MSEFLTLNKFQLISKIQVINRENNQLKTMLIRHQLLTNFYQKLFENCVQLKDLKLNKNNKQNKCDLKSNQMKLLSQIQVFTECDKSVSIGLTKLQSEDIAISHLFIEKSTQYELNESIGVNSMETTLTPIESLTKQMEELDKNVFQSTNDMNSDTECLIDNNLNKEIIETKDDENVPQIDKNETQIKCISIDLNNESFDSSISDFPINSIEKNVEKSTTKKTKQIYVCEYCHKQYKHKKSFNNHMNQIHSYIKNEPKIEDNIKITETNDNKLKDLKISPKSNIIICQWPECRLKFKNRTLFLRHYSIHNESRKMCSDCGLKFEDSNLLREHVMWHSNQLKTNDSHSHNNANGIELNEKSDSFPNDISCDNKTDFKLNFKQNSFDRKLCCDFPNCNYKTSNSSNLEVHQKRAHEKVYTLL